MNYVQVYFSCRCEHFFAQLHSVKESSRVYTLYSLNTFINLDHLTTTATGLNFLSAWYLILGTPAFAIRIARLFNLSVETSIVLEQWKQACVQPIAKVFFSVHSAEIKMPDMVQLTNI